MTTIRTAKLHPIHWLNEPGYRGETWPIVVGCFECGESCRNCWARRLAHSGLRHRPQYQGLTRASHDGSRWTGEVRCREELLLRPLQASKPRKYFVAPTGDLFHSFVSWDFLRHVFTVEDSCPHHQFIHFTKRPWHSLASLELPPNVEQYVSVGTQLEWNLQAPAILKWHCQTIGVCFEPLLDTIDLGTQYTARNRLGHVIVGCESGPNRRPCDPAWITRIVAQCRDYRIPVYVNQIQMPDGRVSRDPMEWPEHLRIREFPQRLN